MPLPDTNHNPQQPEVDSPERREALRRLAKLGIAAGAAPAMITLLWSDRASAQSGPLVSTVTATFPRGNYSSGGPFQAAFPEGTLDLHAGDSVTVTYSILVHGISTSYAFYFYNSSGRAPSVLMGAGGAGDAIGGPTLWTIPASCLPPDGEGPEGMELVINSGGSDFEATVTFSV